MTANEGKRELRNQIEALIFHGLLDPTDANDSALLDILEDAAAEEPLTAAEQLRYHLKMPPLLRILEDAEATARLLEMLEKDA